MDNPKAFPRESYGASDQSGMSLRDWFAGQALAGIADTAKLKMSDDYSACARFAYAFADAMLAEREKRNA